MLGKANERKVDIRICGSGEHTLALLEQAQELCRKSPDMYDHVWLVYDKDYFPAEEFDHVAACCANMRSTSTFHALWSNPCFEVWFLLHFGYSTAELSAAECLQRVDAAWTREYGSPYEKSAKGSFSRLFPLLPHARENAERLQAYHKSVGNAKPSEQCPGTAVPALLDELSPYINHERQSLGVSSETKYKLWRFLTSQQPCSRRNGVHKVLVKWAFAGITSGGSQSLKALQGWTTHVVRPWFFMGPQIASVEITAGNIATELHSQIYTRALRLKSTDTLLRVARKHR